MVFCAYSRSIQAAALPPQARRHVASQNPEAVPCMRLCVVCYRRVGRKKARHPVALCSRNRQHDCWSAHDGVSACLKIPWKHTHVGSKTFASTSIRWLLKPAGRLCWFLFGVEKEPGLKDTQKYHDGRVMVHVVPAARYHDLKSPCRGWQMQVSRDFWTGCSAH